MNILHDKAGAVKAGGYYCDQWSHERSPVACELVCCKVCSRRDALRG